MSGRVAVVTGATSGIGQEVALGLARRGATTVVIGRGEERSATVAREIARVSGNAQIESLGVSDLALRSEMQRVSDECLQRFPRIDVLVNNAGALFRRREVTSDGLERTFALNVLAPFVLTSRLAERIGSSGRGRIVEVASSAHRGHRVDLDDLQQQRNFSGYRTYGISKLELILLTREFARRLKGRGVTVNAAHPGFVRSGFGQNNGGGTALAIRVLARLFGITSASGADTPTFLASDPAVEGVSGEYFVRRRPSSPSAPALDPRTARDLYDACCRLAGLAPIPETVSA